jgi:hypothetical protein
VLDSKVFKAYDVRGIYPDQLDEAGAHAIGRAYVDEFEPRASAVGRDMRLSSPSMAEAVMRGAADSGAGSRARDELRRPHGICEQDGCELPFHRVNSMERRSRSGAHGTVGTRA